MTGKALARLAGETQFRIGAYIAMGTKACQHLAYIMIVAVMLATSVIAQQPDETELLSLRVLEAKRWETKLEHLKEVMDRKQTIADKSEDIFSLLDGENKIVSYAYQEKIPLPEGYSYPYYSTLLSNALELYQENRVPKYFEVLATSAFGINSKVGVVLTQDASSHLDFLIATVKAHKVDATRASLLWMIFRVRDAKGISMARSDEVLSTGMACLNDPSPYVRVKAIDELSRVKTANVLARLIDARRTSETDRFLRSQMELKKLDDAIASFRR